jgi:hypothetical protein
MSCIGETPRRMDDEPYCHLFLIVLDKGSMLCGLARQSEDAINEMVLISINDSIEEKLEPQVTRLGIESERHPARGSKRAPAGQE